MSHVSPSSNVQPQAPKKKGGGVLRVILIVVLLVMLGLLGWDRYARAASKTSFDSVVKWVEQDLEEYTPADVQKLLGRKPDRGLEDKESYALETYSWPRGVLVKSYFVKVIYRKEGDKVLLHEVVHNVEPEQNDLPNPPIGSPTGSELEPPTGSGEDAPADDSTPEEATPADEESPTEDVPADNGEESAPTSESPEVQADTTE
jgi:hypothetical protein